MLAEREISGKEILEDGKQQKWEQHSLLDFCRGGSGPAAPAGLLPYHTAGWTTTVTSHCEQCPAVITGISQDHPTLPETQPEKAMDLMNLIQPVCLRLRRGGTCALAVESSLLQWVLHVGCVWRWHAWGGLWLFTDSTTRPERPPKEHPEAEATVGWRAISESMKC